MARDFSKAFWGWHPWASQHPCQNQAVHPASLPTPLPDCLAVSIETGWISKQNMGTEDHGRS